MKFTTAVSQRIIDKLAERLPEKMMGPCPLCKTAKWNLFGFVPLSISQEPQVVNLGGQILPCVIVTCQNCGNTQFINLIVLGLGDLLTPDPEPSQDSLKQILQEAKAKE